MSINGNGDTLTITGARLKVSGGVQVSGSIAYTDDATGFGGVSAQIDGDDTTLNITAGKTSGVAKIERGTSANITDINHANVSNNTTIHIALKNTSSNKGDFVTIGTFADDDNVKVNYTDEYVIGPGETGMLTLRKVAGVLSLFIREMFSSTATNTNTKPFYIKDGTDYKYPLYKSSDNGGGNLEGVTINGVDYYRPSSGLKTKTRPPLGIPELIISPSGNLAIGNSGNLTTVNYDVWGVPSSFGYGSIYQGSTKKTSFVLENGEASGSFTESGASSGDAYSLYVERTDTSTSDTVSSVVDNTPIRVAFHYGAFTSTDYSSAYSTVEAAAAAGFVYSDTSTTSTYTWGTLNSVDTSTSGQTGYSWTTPNDTASADLLMVAGGGSGGTNAGAGGGAGGLVYGSGITMSGTYTIKVGNGGLWVNNSDTDNGYDSSIENTTYTATALGGGAGLNNGNNVGVNGGSGGGAASESPTSTWAGGSSTQVTSISFENVTLSGFGNDGGIGRAEEHGGWTRAAGGGGGAGATGNTSGNYVTDSGQSARISHGGDGGIGKQYDISGTNQYYAGGGGGGIHNNENDGYPGVGGLGGGGTAGQPYNAGNSGTKNTGGGGGAGGGGGSAGGDGGSGIVIIKFTGVQIGKTIPKVTGASFDSTNVTFTVQGASNITNIKYTINGGSEQTTPVGTLAVAHGLSASASITVVAYAVDANGDQLSTKKTVTGTIP